MKGPKHLWTGDWRAHRDDQPEQRSPLRNLPPPPPEPEPPRSRRGIWLFAAGMATVLLLVAAFAAGDLLSNDKPAPRQRAQAPPARTPIGAIYAKASPAVVSVRTRGATGTGFLFDRDGTLVTNAHVVGRSRQVAVRFGPNGRSIDASVLGTDPSSDLAVLKIAVSDTPNVDPLALADSSRVKVGDTAVAIGNPFGLDRTATAGIVSGLGRHIRAPNGVEIDQVIQTDAPINPGNSGGPLVNLDGQVVGINSAIATSSGSQGQGGSIGLGFAIPIDQATRVAQEIMQNGTASKPVLGVTGNVARTGGAASGAGAQIGQVQAGSPAQQAGLAAGDVVTKVGSAKVEDFADLIARIGSYAPGSQVALTVQSGGATKTVQVTLGSQPDKAATTDSGGESQNPFGGNGGLFGGGN